MIKILALILLAGTLTASPVQDHNILVNGQPYEIKGVCYHPVPKGSNKRSFCELSDDLVLMKEAGINTIRVYEPITSHAVLDEIEAAGLKVIISIGYNQDGKYDILSGSFIEYVENFKNHEAILLWELGNEYNFHPEWFGDDIGNWYRALNDAAKAIQQIDPKRAVSTAHGELPDSKALGMCPDVDVWGMNVYRWDQAASILDDWKKVSSKPMYFAEIGADSYMAIKNAGYKKGYNERAQAEAVRTILEGIEKKDTKCAGAVIFAFSDEWWKSDDGGNDTQDVGGKPPPTGVPYDDVANEEFWGLVKIDRTKKEVFEVVKELWADADSSLLPINARADKNPKPNIIYILADDLGYGDLSSYGQKKFTTPNIDRLATEGIKFTQHYAGSTVCAPSRCSLMTGLHQGHAQVRGNREVKPEGQTPMVSGTVAIPTLLKEAGYVSGMFGKWGLGAPGSASDPTVFFDEFYGYNCQRRAHTYYPDHLWKNGERVELDGKTYSHDLIMAAALDFIKENKDRAFFCYLPVTIPHAAMHAPEALHEKYRKLYPQFEDKVGKYSSPSVTNPIAAFPAMMEHLDNGVGEILDLLKELNLDENTIVIFTSDNGPHQEGGHDPDFWNSNGPLRGIKRDLYEGGIRVPFVARWPGTIIQGSTSDHASAFWDMLPTFCDLAGITGPEKTDGISMLPALTGGKQRQHDYLYWEFSERGGAQAIRKGDLKAVRTGLLKNPEAAIELYDLANDLAESINIAEKHPDIVGDMKKLFLEARSESETFPLFKK